ncbi:TRMT1-like protein [Aplysia californica]|uniref:tRNA (guanine(26)-N(2))-dimethyltransferase n=1 Tax=Aplysia californica TaxID=6500 RepID=A0ABM1A6H7_APLCA|nr:TRMT1-like protein [Aplysia californica]
MEDKTGSAVQEELGVKFKKFAEGKQKSKAKSFNPKLKIFREFSLATLSALLKTKTAQSQRKQQTENAEGDSTTQKCDSLVSALDALANTGVTGLQWKKKLGDEVRVTLSDHSDVSLLTANAEENSLTTRKFCLDGCRVPGDPTDKQGTSEVHVCQADAKAVMMMETFQYIYINAWKNCVTYLESACHSIAPGGMLCVVVSDSSMFARSPHVVKRWYAVDVMKTEYLKEMAARVVLADLAASAGRYNKALVPQYVLAVEDFLLVCVKVTRGHTATESSVNEICKLMHCRFCEERVFMPQQLAPVENPYSMLPCQCKEKNPGKTAVLLGPMWKGPIYCPTFLNVMQQEGKSLGLSAKFSTLVSLLQCESVCATLSFSSGDGGGNNNRREGGALSGISPSNGQNDKTVQSKDRDCGAEKAMGDKSETAQIVEEGNAGADGKCSVFSNVTSDGKPDGSKRKGTRDSVPENAPTPVKKLRFEDSKDDPQLTPARNVPFYQHVNKLKKMKIPKLDQLVTIIQHRGYFACRTHFDPCAIRTTANVDQFLNVLQPQCEK